MPSYKKVDHREFWTNTRKNNNQRNETGSFESPVCYNFPYVNDKKYFKIHFWKQYIWVWCGMQYTAELSQVGDTENRENKPEELAHGLFSFHMIHFLISHPHYQDLPSCSAFALPADHTSFLYSVYWFSLHLHECSIINSTWHTSNNT